MRFCITCVVAWHLLRVRLLQAHRPHFPCLPVAAPQSRLPQAHRPHSSCLPVATRQPPLTADPRPRLPPARACRARRCPHPRACHARWRPHPRTAHIVAGIFASSRSSSRQSQGNISRLCLMNACMHKNGCFYERIVAELKRNNAILVDVVFNGWAQTPHFVECVAKCLPCIGITCVTDYPESNIFVPFAGKSQRFTYEA